MATLTKIWAGIGSLPLVLVPMAVILALLPFGEPHLAQKIGMLTQGTLSKPIDIFDLFMHGTPLFLSILKLIHLAQQKLSGAKAKS